MSPTHQDLSNDTTFSQIKSCVPLRKFNIYFFLPNLHVFAQLLCIILHLRLFSIKTKFCFIFNSVLDPNPHHFPGSASRWVAICRSESESMDPDPNLWIHPRIQSLSGFQLPYKKYVNTQNWRNSNMKSKLNLTPACLKELVLNRILRNLKKTESWD